jgi:hypothetical protein
MKYSSRSSRREEAQILSSHFSFTPKRAPQIIAAFSLTLDPSPAGRGSQHSVAPVCSNATEQAPSQDLSCDGMRFPLSQRARVRESRGSTVRVQFS